MLTPAPPKSPSWPSGAPGPQQPSRSMGRMPVDTKPMACLPPPWSDAAGPQTWPRGQQDPIRRHQVSFPWQARERQAEYYQPQHQDHACPRGPGCPRDARAVGGISLGTGGWQGRGRVAWAQVLSQVRPPRWIPAPTDTVHQALDAIWGGPGKCPGPRSPRQAVPCAPGSACCWRLLGCRRAPPDSQLRVR